MKMDGIIPYQELPGNYNLIRFDHTPEQYYTIPRTTRELQQTTLMYRGSEGLYHTKNYQGTTTVYGHVLPVRRYYTIPRTTRELQLCDAKHTVTPHYTIPRTTRELQPKERSYNRADDYTIPRTTRELQHVAGYIIETRNYTIPRTTRELQPCWFVL